MILFLSNPGEDYQDSIFYAFRKTYGDEVEIWPDKPNYFEGGPEHYRHCHYSFVRSIATPPSRGDIITAAKTNNIKVVFLISSGYNVHEQWDLCKEIKAIRPTIPICIIDGADGDRLQYPHPEYDLYFAREYHTGPLKHEPEHYPAYQREAFAAGTYPTKVFPLPFSIIPEKFPPLSHLKLQYSVFFRGTNSKQRTHFLNGVSWPSSLIALGWHKAIHEQDRIEYARLARSSKICLNIAGGGNDCARFWELLGFGGVVATEDHSQVIEPSFEDGIHVIKFKTKQEMLDKIEYYLKHDEAREKIRETGYKFAMANHTCYHRMRFIISKIKEFNFNW